MIRVGVVDDQPLLVSAFAALIDNCADMRVVGTGRNGAEAIELCSTTEVDVLLLDIRMPVLDGVTATARLCEAGAGARVLILTTFNADELVLGAIAAGARGFLLKDADPDDVLEAIRDVHAGRAVIDPAAAPALLAALRQVPESSPATKPVGHSSVAGLLTRRELEVLTLIGRGRTNREIVAELFIAETTVKTHVGNLLTKLNARDRVALVVLAHSVGLVDASGAIQLP